MDPYTKTFTRSGTGSHPRVVLRAAMPNMLWATPTENEARGEYIYQNVIARSHPTRIAIIMAFTKFVCIALLLSSCTPIASSTVPTPTFSSLTSVGSSIAVVTNAYTLQNGTFPKYLSPLSCSLNTQLLTVTQHPAPRSLCNAALAWKQRHSHSIFHIHAENPRRPSASMLIQCSERRSTSVV